MKPIGLYIHIPFCRSKCPYCDFYSVSSNSKIINQYANTICKMIQHYAKKFPRPIDTIYFGGGTPNLLGEKNICIILNSVKENFELLNPEVTMEVNPSFENIDFKTLRDSGVNRLSIGLQSANTNELEFLGRKHSVYDVIKTVHQAKSAGICNISLDLMLCIQEQTQQSLLESIKFCVDQNIQHISAYMLKIEENTPYFFNSSKLKLKNEDEQRELYLFACEELKKLGFQQYEISNFCKIGFESKHNLKYWNCNEYLGIGPSAHSFIDGKRFYYPRSIEKFLNFEPEIFECYGGNMQEYLMLRLRLSNGVSNEDFKNRFGFALPQKYFNNAKKYEKYGLLNVNNEKISLTPEGFLVSNSLIYKILFN